MLVPILLKGVGGMAKTAKRRKEKSWKLGAVKLLMTGRRPQDVSRVAR